MASELRVNTLKDASGNNSIATSVVASGSAKAWCNFNGEGTAAILDSVNIASLTDSGSGKFSTNFTNAMGNVHYVFTGLAFHSSASGFDDAVCISRDNTQLSSVSTTVNPFYTFRVEGTVQIKDCKENMVTFNGDLA